MVNASEWNQSTTAAALHVALAKRLEEQIRAALTARGQAFLALAGGSTPLPAYTLLRQAKLDWRNVCIVPTDERWVAPTHSASNLHQLQQCFSQPAIHWLPLVPESIHGAASAHAANKLLASMPIAFDVVLLGMGLDAHTASLFPQAEGVESALDPLGLPSAVAITPRELPPEAPFSRISLTLTRLVHTRHLWLAITGAAKRQVLETAMARAPAELPIAQVIKAARSPVDIFWSP